MKAQTMLIMRPGHWLMTVVFPSVPSHCLFTLQGGHPAHKNLAFYPHSLETSGEEN